MKPLRAYRDRHGLSREDLAAVLSERLGRRITVGGVQRFENYSKLPASWTEALGLEAEPAFVAGEAYDAGDPVTAGSGAYAESPPADGQPAGAYDQGGGPAASPGPPPLIFQQGRERLEGAHKMVGGAMSMATGNDGYLAVFDTYAPSLAQAWQDAARAGDKNAIAVMKFMESGGAMGSILVGYATLALACVYVSGRAPAAGIIVGRFAPYHQLARERAAAAAAAAAEGDIGGSDPWGDNGWLGADPGAPDPGVATG